MRTFHALAILLVILVFPSECMAQRVSLSANMMELASEGTIGLEASYGAARRLSVGVGASVNPSAQQSYKVSARYWPWHIYSGWWLSGAVKYQEYNANAYSSIPFSEGDKVGASVSGGYSRMLTPHLNLDFGLGLWYGRDYYTTYSCRKCGRIVERGARTFLKPSDFAVALSWIF